MFDLALFVLLVSIGVGCAIALFIQKSLFKAAIALAIVFVVVAGFILLTGQFMIALFQLLILVGGLSTYLIVAVASEREASFKHINLKIFIPVFVLMAAVLIYAVFATTATTTAPTMPGILDEISNSIQNNFALMAAIVFLMFALAIGSIMLIKKVVKLVV